MTVILTINRWIKGLETKNWFKSFGKSVKKHIKLNLRYDFKSKDQINQILRQIGPSF
jgi:hypothetical protein